MSKHRANDAEEGIVNPKKQKAKGHSTVLDTLIGQQIRELRKKRGYSQTDLGLLIGVTYQQVQKYETAQNRIAASTLLLTSVKTGESMEYFVKTARAYLKETEE